MAWYQHLFRVLRRDRPGEGRKPEEGSSAEAERRGNWKRMIRQLELRDEEDGAGEVRFGGSKHYLYWDEKGLFIYSVFFYSRGLQ